MFTYIILFFIGTLVLTLLATLFSFLSVWVNSGHLSYYIMNHKPKRFDELTTIGIWGPGLVNPFKGLAYINSDRDNDDDKILDYKRSIKRDLKYVKLSLLSVLINLVLIFGLVILGNLFKV